MSSGAIPSAPALSASTSELGRGLGLRRPALRLAPALLRPRNEEAEVLVVFVIAVEARLWLELVSVTESWSGAGPMPCKPRCERQANARLMVRRVLRARVLKRYSRGEEVGRWGDRADV